MNLAGGAFDFPNPVQQSQELTNISSAFYTNLNVTFRTFENQSVYIFYTMVAFVFQVGGLLWESSG